jgi:cytidylate kinase
MLAIFLDGESKSGKTAVGRNIKQSLEDQGYKVRLIVAGHFFRFLTKLALESLPVGADEISDAQIHAVLDSPELYGEMPDVQALNTHQIDKWVSRLGERGFVQEAANNWRIKTAQRALDDGIEIVLLDGRNLREKLADWAKGAQVRAALELIIACRPEVAAARYLGGRHVSQTQLVTVTEQINERRRMDRQRAEAAYVDPAKAVALRPGSENVAAAVETAWAPEVEDPPRPIRFDNSDVPLKLGLATVTELAEKSVQKAKSK